MRQIVFISRESVWETTRQLSTYSSDSKWKQTLWKSQIKLKGQRLIDGSKGRTNLAEIHGQEINL